MSVSKPHSSDPRRIDWAETLRGHIILNIDEPWKTPAMKALGGLIEQHDRTSRTASQRMTRALAAEDRVCELEEQLETAQRRIGELERRSRYLELTVQYASSPASKLTT